MHLNTGKQSWKAVKAVPVITSHFDKSEHLLQSGHKTSDEEVNAEEIHEENIQDLLTRSTSPEEGSKELWSSQQFCGESYAEGCVFGVTHIKRGHYLTLLTHNIDWLLSISVCLWMIKKYVK